VSPAAIAALAAGRRPVVVCLLRLRGGTVYAWGTEAIRIARRGIDTAAIQVLPGLVVDDVESVIDPFGLEGETALTQAQVSVVLSSSLAADQGDWRYLGAATAELARVWPGDVWEDRTSMLAGTRLSGVTLGVAGAPSAFTLEAARPQTSAALGDATRTLGADFPTPLDTTAAALTSLEGVEYPAVYGAPYRSSGFKIGQIGGDGYDRVVIAGHAWADLSNVPVYEDGVILAATYAVLTATTSSGTYAYIRSNAGAFSASTGAITIHPRWGGIPDRMGAGAALTFATILELWLSLSGLTVNWGRMRPALDRLRSWTGGVYFDAETPALDAVRDHIVSVAPLVEMQSADGIWFYLADFIGRAVRGTLTEGQELIGAAGVVSLTEIEDLRNSVTVRYAYDEFLGEFTASTLVDADTDAAAYVSRQLYGELVSEVIESAAVADAVTARRVGRALLHRRAYQRRVMSWLVSDSSDIDVGEAYRMVAPSYAIDRTAIVTGIRGVAGRIVTFTVLDGPL
jgi:hypothetical protein